MRVGSPLILVLILLLGFLTGSSLYFYNKSRVTTKNKIGDATFSGEIPEAPAVQASEIDQKTVPAEPKGRLSYPANTYAVQPKETLFAIGAKMGVSWQLIKNANGIANENSIQAADVIVVPKLDPYTEYYRVNFLINDGKATDLNRELRDAEHNELFDSKNVAKKDALTYFGVKAEDEFTLLEEDLSKGTALVEAKGPERLNYIGLIQPRVKGKKGFWALLYVERREVSE